MSELNKKSEIIFMCAHAKMNDVGGVYRDWKYKFIDIYFRLWEVESSITINDNWGRKFFIVWTSMQS